MHFWHGGCFTSFCSDNSLTQLKVPLRQKELAMLVLTRKLDESIQISDNIKITILRIKGNTVRIGIEAPRDVRVVRTELTAEERQSALEALEPAGQVDSQVAAAIGGLAGVSAGREQVISTVTTIVDSPTIAGPRLFVGSVTEDGQSVELRADVACISPTNDSFELHSMLTTEQVAPLRAFLRSGRGLTAV